MKLSVPNELFFTVFLGKEESSKRMRDIFEEYYGNINQAFTGLDPMSIYDSKSKKYTVNENKPQENILTWNKGGK